MTTEEPADSEGGEWALVDKFFIDTDGYSDRDRLMFVCGYEINDLLWLLTNKASFYMLLHTENASRFRMILGQKGRKFTLTQHVGYEGCETWSDLHVHQ